MASSAQYQRTGSFMQTTQIWGNESDRQLLIRLYQNINQISLILNTKSTGAFYLQEFVIGDLYFPNPLYGSNDSQPAPVERQVSRSVVNIGTLTDGITPNTVPHNLQIGDKWTFVSGAPYGSATNPTAVAGTRRFIPLPYPAVVPADTLEVYVTNTDVVITSGGTDYSNFTQAYVVLEWIVD